MLSDKKNVIYFKRLALIAHKVCLVQSTILQKQEYNIIRTDKKIQRKNRKKRQISRCHVHQCTRLKMSAVTLLPVFPPNWKVGVGNSSTNTNPVKKHREKVQVKKYACANYWSINMSGTHKPCIFFGWLWPQGGLEKHCQPNKLSVPLSVVFPGSSKDSETCLKYPLHSLPSHFHFVCTSLQKIRQMMSHLKPITPERKWLTKPSHRESVQMLTYWPHTKLWLCPSWKDFCIKADYQIQTLSPSIQMLKLYGL